MRDTIKQDYNNLTGCLQAYYNKVKVIDDYDWYDSNPYTIFYLNKNESFDKFHDLWNNVINECRDNDFSYDDMLNEFDERAKDEFDYIELGTLDIYTDSDYELMI